MQPSKIPCVLFLLACLTGVVLAQTFQYSRGWVNGRKRSGSVLPAIMPGDEPNPCQLQRLQMILEGRNLPHLYLPCEMWRPSLENTMTEEVNDRYNRRPSMNEIVPSMKNDDVE